MGAFDRAVADGVRRLQARNDLARREVWIWKRLSVISATTLGEDPSATPCSASSDFKRLRSGASQSSGALWAIARVATAPATTTVPAAPLRGSRRAG